MPCKARLFRHALDHQGIRTRRLAGPLAGRLLHPKLRLCRVLEPVLTSPSPSMTRAARRCSTFLFSIYRSPSRPPPDPTDCSVLLPKCPSTSMLRLLLS